MNWCFWTVVLEKTLESRLDWQEMQTVHPKGNQSWIFTGRTDAEAETPILWPPDVKNWLISKDPDAGKDWRQEEKGTTEDEMVGLHHCLSGYEFEQTLGIDDGQGSLGCCSPINREAWHAVVHGVTKSWTRLSDWTTTKDSTTWAWWFQTWIGKGSNIISERGKGGGYQDMDRSWEGDRFPEFWSHCCSHLALWFWRGGFLVCVCVFFFLACKTRVLE